jgi:outer membrane protein assembly factor BamB
MSIANFKLIDNGPEGLFRAWKATAILAGLFCLAACLLMVTAHFRAKSQDPFKSPQLAALRAELQANPKDGQLKEQIRALDLRLRQRYFRHLEFSSTGAWLALGSAIVFLLACKRTLDFRRQLPNPKSNPTASEEFARARTLSRWSVAGVGTVACVALLAAGFNRTTVLPSRIEDLEKLLGSEPSLDAAPAHYAQREEMLRNWPRFRGLYGDGVIAEADIPLAWDETTLLWKTKVALEGFNSPIVWENRIFLSGGDASGRGVACYDARTGELLWQQPIENVPGAPGRTPDVPEHTGYAAATMATDGRQVYVIFANGDLAALSFEGRQLWARNLGVPKNPHGHATSLATWTDKVIVQYDQGDSEQNASKLLAIEGRTGRTAWQRTRPVGVSWATPIVIEAAGKQQIITLSVPWLISYSADNGAEIWRADGFGGEVAPSPIFAAGLVLAISPYDRMLAFRPDGQGEVTETHLAWQVDEGDIPDITTPVANGELVFMLSTPGTLTCFDLKDGAKVWEHELEVEFHASPALVGRHIYLITTKGEVIVLDAAREYQELARSNIGEKIYATPAFAGNRVFIRGLENLYAFGTKDQVMAATK